MPDEGVIPVSHKDILTYEEALLLINIFSGLGINKLRITGGEPFVRKGLSSFLETVVKTKPSIAVYITTNGILLNQYLHTLKEIGIRGINLSVDTLMEEKFKALTGRDFPGSIESFINELIESQIPFKINTVILKNLNFDEIPAITAIAQKNDIEVRFIEQMPFNGRGDSDGFVDRIEIFKKLQNSFPFIEKLKNGNSTADLFSIPGFKGRIGIIGSYTRSFCGNCNKIRITPAGMLKLCLYDDGVLDLREMLRNGYSAKEIEIEIINCINKKFKNGFAAEQESISSIKSSMSGIGG
jgi:cyclic pyranopterin phosphate synthase